MRRLMMATIGMVPLMGCESQAARDTLDDAQAGCEQGRSDMQRGSIVPATRPTSKWELTSKIAAGVIYFRW
jgi:hypothetical protein